MNNILDEITLNNFICNISNENYDVYFDLNTDISDNIELKDILLLKLEEYSEDIIIDEYKLYNEVKTINDLVKLVMDGLQ